jgi:tripartite-type tricarboxylate transporter receptor subunit TctC
MDQVAKSNDGHTLGVMFMPHAVLPALVEKMPYDTLKDLVPISQTQWTYNVLVVRSNVPANNMSQLVDLVKKNPGKLVAFGVDRYLNWVVTFTPRTMFSCPKQHHATTP